MALDKIGYLGLNLTDKGVREMVLGYDILMPLLFSSSLPREASMLLDVPTVGDGPQNEGVLSCDHPRCRALSRVTIQKHRAIIPVPPCPIFYDLRAQG